MAIIHLWWDESSSLSRHFRQINNKQGNTMTEQDKIVVLEDNHRLRATVDTLRRERDEARRWICEAGLNSIKMGKELAALRGWDCYKEETQ